MIPLRLCAFASLRFPQVVDYTAKAVFDQPFTKVDDQAQFVPDQPQVGQCLDLKDAIVIGGCFALNDDFVTNQ